MKTRTMSINAALNELKLIDKKIDRKIMESQFATVSQEDVIRNSKDSIKEFKSKAQGSLDSIQALISNRNEIKAGIVNSNATTIVEVAGKSMTVAEAIERKTSISYEKDLLSVLREQAASAQRKVEVINSKLEAEASRNIENVTANLSKETKDGIDLAALRAPFLKQEASLVEGIPNLMYYISNLAEEIDDFESNVDLALNESNVLTKITLGEA